MKKPFGILMSHDEYKANVSGLNIFFGAILGVVMAEIVTPSPLIFSFMLLVVASFVIMILYINASKHRLTNAVVATGVLMLCWYRVYQGDDFHGLDVEWIGKRMLPTLSVWLLMTVFIEFYPREAPKSEQSHGNDGTHNHDT